MKIGKDCFGFIKIGGMELFGNTIAKNSNHLVGIISRSFATAKKKSIYSSSNSANKSELDFNRRMNANTIDITESQKEFEKEKEKEKLEKLINRANPSEKKINTGGNAASTRDINTSQNETQDNLNSNKNFNFDYFKKRNQEINTKAKAKEKEKEPEINKNTLSKLEELINSDEKNNSFDKFQIFNNKGGIANMNALHNINANTTIINESDEDNTGNNSEEKSILVHRPLKNFVWGLGEKTKQKKFKFSKGEYPTVESVVNYLEVNNLHDIIVVPTHKLGLLHLKENAILCSGFTAKHIYKVAKDFVVEIKKLQIPNLPFTPTVFGRRDEEWLIVEIGEIQIHFFVETFRSENDLLERWTNPPSEDFLNWQRRVENKFYGKKKLR